VAVKFAWLDSRKSPPVLQKFLTNMELVHKLLGEIESELIDASDDGIATLQAEAQEIIDIITKWSKKVEDWNSKNARVEKSNA